MSDDPELHENCAWIADRCRERAGRSVPLPDQKAKSALAPLLSVNEYLHALMAMPVNSGHADDKKLIVLPSKEVPFFVPGTLTRTAWRPAQAGKCDLFVTR
jgi:multidrug resistance protein MdtO